MGGYSTSPQTTTWPTRTDYAMNAPTVWQKRAELGPVLTTCPVKELHSTSLEECGGEDLLPGRSAPPYAPSTPGSTRPYQPSSPPLVHSYPPVTDSPLTPTSGTSSQSTASPPPSSAKCQPSPCTSCSPTPWTTGWWLESPYTPTNRRTTCSITSPVTAPRPLPFPSNSPSLAPLGKDRLPKTNSLTSHLPGSLSCVVHLCSPPPLLLPAPLP